MTIDNREAIWQIYPLTTTTISDEEKKFCNFDIWPCCSTVVDFTNILSL